MGSIQTTWRANKNKSAGTKHDERVIGTDESDESAPCKDGILGVVVEVDNHIALGAPRDATEEEASEALRVLLKSLWNASGLRVVSFESLLTLHIVDVAIGDHLDRLVVLVAVQGGHLGL